MHFVREIRLRRVKCLRALGGFISFHIAKQYFTIVMRLFHICPGANISLKYQLKRKNRLIFIVSLFLFISAHLLTTYVAFVCFETIL